jgi:hypothetical protein
MPAADSYKPSGRATPGEANSRQAVKAGRNRGSKWLATHFERGGRRDRGQLGSLDLRGIVAASTAATFSAAPVAAGIDGATKLLPATFLVIVEQSRSTASRPTLTGAHVGMERRRASKRRRGQLAPVTRLPGATGQAAAFAA